MQNAGLDKSQAGIKGGKWGDGAGREGSNINNLRHAHDTTLMAESEED